MYNTAPLTTIGKERAALHGFRRVPIPHQRFSKSVHFRRRALLVTRSFRLRSRACSDRYNQKGLDQDKVINRGGGEADGTLFCLHHCFFLSRHWGIRGSVGPRPRQLYYCAFFSSSLFAEKAPSTLYGCT